MRIAWSTQRELADVGAKIAVAHLGAENLTGPKAGESLAAFWQRTLPDIAIVSQDAPFLSGPDDLFQAIASTHVRVILVTQQICDASRPWLRTATSLGVHDIVLANPDGVDMEALLARVRTPASQFDVMPLLVALSQVDQGEPSRGGAGSLRRAAAAVAEAVGTAQRRQAPSTTAVPHLRVGVIGPSPGMVFRTVGEIATAWAARSGDVEVVVADSLGDPSPPGEITEAGAYRDTRSRVTWHSLGTAATQAGMVQVQEIADHGGTVRVERMLRLVYQRRTRGPALTLLALGNPFWDPIAKEALAHSDVLVWACETGDDLRIAAQWQALLDSVEATPGRVASLDVGVGSLDGCERWDVGDGWDAAVDAILGGQ